jgi:transcriptional regulator with XRE-family HTH domain
MALAILRLASRFSQDDLARRSSIRPSSISDYERGKIIPGAEILAKLLAAQGLPFEALDRALEFVVEVERLTRRREDVVLGDPSSSRLDSAPIVMRQEIEALAHDLGQVVTRAARLLFLLLASLKGGSDPAPSREGEAGE